MAVVAGEVGDEPVRVDMVTQPERGELDARGPTLGPGVQGLDLDRVEPAAADLPDGFLRLVDGQGQVAGPELEDVATQSQAWHPRESVVPADEHEADAVRGPFGQVPQFIEDDRADEGLQVLDHHGGRSGLGQLGHHHREEILAEGHPVGPNVVDGAAPRTRHELLEPVDEPSGEPNGVIGRPGGHPEHPPFRVGRVPLGEEDGLAVARRGDDQHHAPARRRLDAVDEGGTVYDDVRDRRGGAPCLHRHLTSPSWPRPGTHPILPN